MRTNPVSLAAVLMLACAAPAQDPPLELPARGALSRMIELDRGDSTEVTLWNGRTVRVKLLEVEEERCSVRGAVRAARVKVEIDGEPIALRSANYSLPVTVGSVQIDCPITRGYYTDARHDYWGLKKDARLRLWPASSPWARPDRFIYPVRQRWFASNTQMTNEPCYIDGGEDRGPGRIYYHFGLDIGGCEKLVDAVSLADARIVGLAGEMLPEYEEARPHHGFGQYQILLMDDYGWFFRYAHFHEFETGLKLGDRVKRGQNLGLLGKTGGTRWSHIHVDARRKLPSGRWVLEEIYAYFWEAYHREFKPSLVAVARPHHVIREGEPVTLDGTRSWSRDRIARYDWTFSDGSTAEGPKHRRTYGKQGFYSEVLKVTDAAGREDYDFTIVMVFDRDDPKDGPPTIHASYAPSFDIRPGQPVTFKVRTFDTTHGGETWDFGDGTPAVRTRSDGGVVAQAPDGYAQTVHRFEKPGLYLVRVERTDETGVTSTCHLDVRVGADQLRRIFRPRDSRVSK